MTTLAAATAGHTANPLTVILLAIGIVAAYALSLFVWPWRPCPRCRGTRVNPGSNRRRYGMCTRCAGTGRTRRIGATAVHRFYWSALGDQLHARRWDKIARRHRNTGHPDL